MSESGPETRAQRLKQVADELYRRHFYIAALGKYDEVLEMEMDNRPKAILHSNKAQCLIQLKRYLDAISEARAGTRLDPSFSKGWIRMAQAYKELAEFDLAVRFWRKAIDTLPRSLSDADIRLKEECELRIVQATNLKNASLDLTGKVHHVPEKSVPPLPWDKAAEMIEAAETSGHELSPTSSAWVISRAYKEYNQGVERVKLLTMEESGRGQRGFFTLLHGALPDLTNGLLRDKRVLHAFDPQFWNKAFLYARTEAVGWEAWQAAGPGHVLSEAQDRVRTQGWKWTRPALSTTVRMWILRGVFAAYIQNDYPASIHWYSNAIEIINAGQEIWSDVPNVEKGQIFNRTFRRGIEVLQLDALMMSYHASPSQIKMLELQKLARRVLTDVRSEEPLRNRLMAEMLASYKEKKEARHQSLTRRPPSTQVVDQPTEVDVTEETDFGFISSFYIYPMVEAFAAGGYCEREFAVACISDPEKRKQHFVNSGINYGAAAKWLNQDDEKYCLYTRLALDAFWRALAPVGQTLMLMRQVRESVPKAGQIWQFSQISQQPLDNYLTISEIAEYEDQVLDGLARGSITEADRLAPPMPPLT